MASEKELLEIVRTYASLQDGQIHTQTLPSAERILFELVMKGNIEQVEQHLLVSNFKCIWIYYTFVLITRALDIFSVGQVSLRIFPN